ncbi:MAG: hypothetical protein ACW986_03915 [Promethearchaeota archaeon]|jgi:hypothetical protein
MKSCTNCGAKIDQNYEICPFCFVVLVPEKHPRKEEKFEKLKRLKIGGTYSIFILFFISYIVISRSCYQSENLKCYNFSFVFLILCVCSCCISWLILGADTDLKTAESLMAAKKPKKSQTKTFLLVLGFIIIFIVIFVFITSWLRIDLLPLS